MASSEYDAFRARMAAQPAPPPPASLDELRQRIDASMGQLSLAEGTSASVVDAGGVRAQLCRRDGGEGDPTVVYFHGGGYRMASALAYRSYGSHLARACRAQVLLVDYRLAPEHAYPAAVHDAVSSYRWVLDGGARASRVVVAGDSAGGGLAAALPMALRAEGLPQPAGVVCLSPWVDLTNTTASFGYNAARDQMFSKTSADQAAELYLAGQDPKDPLVSPLFGDWSGLPPMLIQVGSGEVLLDDAARLAELVEGAGVAVERHVYEEMPHVWQLNYPAFPEAVAAVEEIARFVQRVTS